MKWRFRSWHIGLALLVMGVASVAALVFFPPSNRPDHITPEMVERIGDGFWNGHPWTREEIVSLFGPPEAIGPSTDRRGMTFIRYTWHTSKWPDDDDETGDERSI
jgi:hypothetical protein